MGDDDLIKRGDALKALDWGDIYGRNAQASIRAIPAADTRAIQDDAASRRRKLLGYMDDKAEVADLRDRVARLECAGDFARLIGNDASKDDKDTVLVTYGMLRRLRDAIADGDKHA